MRGLILAAGTGTRLRPLTDRRPKPLIEVGGVTLLERQLRLCARAALCEAVVVTGHAHDVLSRWLGDHPLPLPVVSVHNEQYAALNNGHSVWVARDALAGAGFVQFDGDLLLDPGIVDRLLASEWPSALAVDRNADRDGEAMKAAVDESGRVTGLGKWLSAAESVGEAIGLGKFAAEDTERLFAGLQRIVHRDGRGDAYYEDVYHQLLQEGWQLGAEDTAALTWTEIDDRADLDRAHALAGQLDS